MTLKRFLSPQSQATLDAQIDVAIIRQQQKFPIEFDVVDSLFANLHTMCVQKMYEAEFDLHLRYGHANAVMRTSSKGQIRHGHVQCAVLWREAFRIEARRIGPILLTVSKMKTYYNKKLKIVSNKHARSPVDHGVSLNSICKRACRDAQNSPRTGAARQNASY